VTDDDPAGSRQIALPWIDFTRSSRVGVHFKNFDTQRERNPQPRFGEP
jgi:hypothetical protein